MKIGSLVRYSTEKSLRHWNTNESIGIVVRVRERITVMWLLGCNGYHNTLGFRNHHPPSDLEVI
jgi:hypothetical protein